MIAFDKSKTLFACPTKCGTMSLVAFAKQVGARRQGLHACVRPPNTDGYAVYMMMRDPVQRARSMWKFYRYGENLGRASRKVQETLKRECEDYEQFLKKLIPLSNQIGFLKPQTTWIIRSGVQYLIRLEDAGGLVPGLCGNPNADFPTENRSIGITIEPPELESELVHAWAAVDAMLYNMIPAEGGILDLRARAEA